MDEKRLKQIVDHFNQVRVLVIGDFFLDKYLILDSALTEVSIETGLDAYQVVGKRLSPGAAGSVTCNLRALEAQVCALGMIGDDGEGYELKAGLEAIGVGTDLLVRTDDRFTPTYTKPMLLESGIERELNRLDIKNRQPCPKEVEGEIIRRLRMMSREVDGVIVADQVQEANCGVITGGVRDELSALSEEHTDKVFIADSRTRIGYFRKLWIKPNKFEAHFALRNEEPASVTLQEAVSLGRELQKRTGRPLFVTLSDEGILSVSSQETYHVPTMRQTGPIDIVGAGDSTMAGIVLALCSGARPEEAAVLGNLVASITVQQIGVTGSASRAQVLQRFGEFGDQFEPRRIA